jgi:hypothetical protein
MSTETADAATLLSHLRTLGARVVIDGDALVVDVPRGLLTPTVRAGITRAKPALLAILAGEARELDPDATARAVPDAADTADVAPNAGPASVPRCAGCGSVRVRPSVSGRNLVCLARGCWYLTPTGAPGRK